MVSFGYNGLRKEWRMWSFSTLRDVRPYNGAYQELKSNIYDGSACLPDTNKLIYRFPERQECQFH